jgi:DNA recombination protein RmuC
MSDMVVVVGIAGFLLGLMIGLVVWYRARIRLAGFEKDVEAEGEKLKWIEASQERLKDAFTLLAHDALQANSETLTAKAKQDLEGLVKPLNENVTNLEKNVREMEKSREGAYQGIKEQLKSLGETHATLQHTTSSLTEALKSPTVRGRWGELQLRRVVEMAGMLNHVSFEEQPTTDAGRPDMIIHLPNAGVLPIDSKVPMDSYMAAMEESDQSRRQDLVKAHARALRNRVRDLAQKQYWDQFENNPDFVIMFVPNEGCLAAAFEIDPTIFDFAIGKKVLPCGPVNLVALLRAVAYGWQQQTVAENANRIADAGRELYSRLEVFVKHLSTLGKHIDSSIDSYNKAVASLDRRLMPSAKRFQELGISETEIESPKQIDTHPSESSFAPTENDDSSDDA